MRAYKLHQHELDCAKNPCRERNIQGVHAVDMVIRLECDVCGKTIYFPLALWEAFPTWRTCAKCHYKELKRS